MANTYVTVLQYGLTALMAASHNGYTKVVQMLLDACANKDAVTEVSCPIAGDALQSES